MHSSEHKSIHRLPFLREGESAYDFIKNNFPRNHIDECNCCSVLTRRVPANVRDYADVFIVNLFDYLKWPKGEPIHIADVAAGKLLQAATIVTGLINAGYKVNLSIMDFSYTDCDDLSTCLHPLASISKELLNNTYNGYYDRSIYENLNLPEQFHQSREYRRAAINQFLTIYAIKGLRELLTVLNREVGEQRAVLSGVFSHVDSYLATVKGIKPLQYERVNEDVLKERLAQGEKRRYLALDLRTESEKNQNQEKLTHQENQNNERFAREFSQGNQTKFRPPDLVLTIDDIYNFSPAKVDYGDYAQLGSEYAFEHEVLEPIQAMHPDAVFFGTKKSRAGMYQGHIEVEVRQGDVLINNNGNGAIPVYNFSPIITEKRVIPFSAEEKEQKSMNEKRIIKEYTDDFKQDDIGKLIATIIEAIKKDKTNNQRFSMTQDKELKQKRMEIWLTFINKVKTPAELEPLLTYAIQEVIQATKEQFSKNHKNKQELKNKKLNLGIIYEQAATFLLAISPDLLKRSIINSAIRMGIENADLKVFLKNVKTANGKSAKIDILTTGYIAKLQEIQEQKEQALLKNNSQP